MAFFTNILSKVFKRKSNQVSLADAKRMAEVQNKAIEEFTSKAKENSLLPGVKDFRPGYSKKSKYKLQGSYSNRISERMRKGDLLKGILKPFGNFTPIISKWYLPRKAAQMK